MIPVFCLPSLQVTGSLTYLMYLPTHFIISIRSHYLERASALDFKDAAAPRFSHRDVVFVYFSNEHRKVPPVNHQKCSINGICGAFDTKSNHFGPVIPKKLKKVF